MILKKNPDNALYRELDTEEDIALLADDIRRAGLLHNLVVFPRPVLAENMCCFPASAACVHCACWWSRIKREQEEKQLPNRMSEWQKVQCKSGAQLDGKRKKLCILTAQTCKCAAESAMNV